MSLDKNEFGICNTDQLLSAGICDTCMHPKMVNTGGDGIQEPSYMELFCEERRLFIEPQPIEDRVKDCDSFKLNKYQ